LSGARRQGWSEGQRLRRRGASRHPAAARCIIGVAVCGGVLLRAFTDLGSARPTDLLFVTAPGATGRVAGPRSSVASQQQQKQQLLSREVGAQRAASADEMAEAPPLPARSTLVQAWGAFGVVAYLSFGVSKVVPIVLEGINTIAEPWEWALLAVTLLFFAYVEGYRGFQLGFSPRVVSRSWCVAEDNEDAPLWHKILAPAFCIGYFHGTTKRVATSWGVTTVIFLVVIGVKQLGNPYRAIIDAGVIVGLVWGIVSIIILFLSSLQNDQPPDYDPALPEDTPYKTYTS